MATPGIYIPNLVNNITEEQLACIFKKNNILTPEKFNFNFKNFPNGKKRLSVFIHVKEWHTNETAQKMRQTLINNEDVKIMINNHWFFICKRKHELHELNEDQKDIYHRYNT
jgi:hypothetical protein